MQVAEERQKISQFSNTCRFLFTIMSNNFTEKDKHNEKSKENSSNPKAIYSKPSYLISDSAVIMVLVKCTQKDFNLFEKLFYK